MAAMESTNPPLPASEAGVANTRNILPESWAAAAAAATARAKKAEDAAVASAADFNMLASQFQGMQAMVQNLKEWLESTITYDSDGGERGKDIASEALTRVSTLLTYSNGHVLASEQATQRAQVRVNDAKKATADADTDELIPSDSEINSASKMPDETYQTPTAAASRKKKAKKASVKKATHVAKIKVVTPTISRPQKPTPTKLDKDISKELKILATKTGLGNDKTSDYVVKSSVWRLEETLIKNGTEGTEAFLSQGGGDVIMKILAHCKLGDRCSWYSHWTRDDKTKTLGPTANIIAALCPCYILESQNLDNILDTVVKHWHFGGDDGGSLAYQRWRKKNGLAFKRPAHQLLEVVGKCAETDPETFARNVKIDHLKEIIDFASREPHRYSEDEPAVHDAEHAVNHGPVVHFVRIVAQTPDGREALLKALPRDELGRVLDNHGNEVTFNVDGRWGRGTETEGKDCEDSCRCDADRAKDLLLGAPG